MKSKQYRNEHWRIEVRDYPCVFTNSPQVDGSHIRWGSNTGTGQKPHDYYIIPLNYKLHKEEHTKGAKTTYFRLINEYPKSLSDFMLSHAKLLHLEWLAKHQKWEDVILILMGEK